MNFVVWPDCGDKRSRPVHTAFVQIQPLVLGSVDTIAVS